MESKNVRKNQKLLGVGAIASLLSLCLLAPSAAFAIGSVTAGDVTFEYTTDFNTSRGDTVDTSFTGAATGNQTYESWWFYRVSGDFQETAFGTPDSESYVGAVGGLGWSDPTGAGLFSASLGFEAIDNGTDAGNLFQNMRIVNTSASSLTIDIFYYADLEVGGGSSGDSAVLGTGVSGIVVDVTDGADTAPIAGYEADAFAVSTWGRGSSVLRQLTNGSETNFGNTGLPFASGDITVGFQWSRTLAAGATEDFLTQFGSNSPLLDPSVTVVPEPNTALLLGIGLVALARRSRSAA